MKRTVKVGLVMLIVGLIMAGAGFMMHGAKGVVWGSGHALQVTEKRTLTPTIGRFKRITVDTNVPVIIRQGPRRQVTITTWTKEYPQVRVSQGQLLIKGHDGYGGVQFGDQRIATVVVTVPANQQLAAIQTVNNADAAITLQHIHAQQIAGAATSWSLTHVQATQPLKLRGTNADIHLQEVTAPALQLDAPDTDITITQSSFSRQNNRLNVGNGDLTIEQTQLGGGQLTTGDGVTVLRDNQLRHRLQVTGTDGTLNVGVKPTDGVTLTASDDAQLRMNHRRVKSGTQIHPKATPQYRLTMTQDGVISVRQ